MTLPEEDPDDAGGAEKTGEELLDDAPQEVPVGSKGEDLLADAPEDAPGLHDATWSEQDWQDMLGRLIAAGIVSWRDVTTAILGELNPGQVGTGIASAKKSGYKKNHATLHDGKSFMPFVIEWLYEQNGRCVDCRTRLDLQSDHIIGREEYDDPHDADWLTNLCLRCRRHNVSKRRSHKARAGRTLLPAQQALMWILLEIRPKTKRDLGRLCRLYGMTMSSIRFDEAWAMAIWLERDGDYQIASDDDDYDLILWADSAVTRRFSTNEPAPEGAEVLAQQVRGSAVFCFVSTPLGTDKTKYTELPVADIPFAYELGARTVTEIAVWPTHGVPSLAPRGHDLHAHVVRGLNDVAVLYAGERRIGEQVPRKSGGHNGRQLTKKERKASSLTLRVEPRQATTGG